MTIDDELDKEISKYSEVGWVDAVQKSLCGCIRRKEIAEIYTGPVERASYKKKEKA